MRSFPLTVVALALALATSAFADGRQKPEAPGYPLFRQYCSTCHGIRADGNGPFAPMLDPRPADLTRLAQEYGSPLAKTKLIYFDDRGRPVRVRVCREQLFLGVKPLAGIEAARRGTLLTIVSYLHSIQALVTPD